MAHWGLSRQKKFNHLNAELNPICRLLALLGAHHIFHVRGLRVNKLCLYTRFLPKTQCGSAHSFFSFISHTGKKITPVQ